MDPVVVGAEYQSVLHDAPDVWHPSNYDIEHADPVARSIRENDQGYCGGHLRYRYVYSDGARGPVVEPLPLHTDNPTADRRATKEGE